MKIVIRTLGPFLFLGTILFCMYSFKHEQTLSIVEEATIQEHLSTFEKQDE